MPALYGSVTPRVAAAATAASTALPPLRRTSIAAADASGSTVLTAPPYPVAVAVLAVSRGSACAGAATAPPVTLNARAAVTATSPRVIYAMIAPESVLRVLTVLVTLLRRRATLNTRADGIGCSSGSCQKWAVVWLQDRSHQKLSVPPEMI